MSVETSADKALAAARDAVQLAVAHLYEIVIDQVQGADQFTPEFRKVLYGNLLKLIEINRDINN
jgi:hypothetical protein